MLQNASSLIRISCFCGSLIPTVVVKICFWLFRYITLTKGKKLKIILTQAFLSSVMNALTSGAKTLSVRSVLTLEMQFVSYSHRQML